MDFIIASITSTAIVGIAAGSGYLQERFNVEQQLFDALPVKLQDASILLALIVVLLNWLGYYLSTGVGTARSKFNVGAPVCYPTEKEVCFSIFFLFFYNYLPKPFSFYLCCIVFIDNFKIFKIQYVFLASKS